MSSAVAPAGMSAAGMSLGMAIHTGRRDGRHLFRKRGAGSESIQALANN